jgi:hypothetical protein
MNFGVFDHIDESGLPVGRQFEERLALIERYEQAGFHAYHPAEHHGTPLGHAPSPSVFLAAATSARRRRASARWSTTCRSTDLIFGDITFEEASRTVELFESEIIPAFDPVAAR